MRSPILLAGLVVVLVLAPPLSAQLVREGRVHCESVDLLKLSDEVQRKGGLDEWRSWLRAQETRCVPVMEPFPVQVVPQPTLEPFNRKVIIGLRSERWEGLRYAFRQDVEP